MSLALELAWRAAGQTHPNPLVGAVVVNNGGVVGEGYHHRCGESHAEVVALDRAGEGTRGGTLYVSLEPCVHHGRTPPCIDRIIGSGVRRVVIPAIDPDERMSGRGVARLRNAGIQVDVGCQETAAITTNLGYYKNQLALGPTVVLKMAVTLDGKIASKPGNRSQVTGETSLRYGHRLRANSDGIVVGLGTVRADDPRLDCRLVGCGAMPAPVVLDGALGMPCDNRWAEQGRPYFVVGGESASTERKAALESSGARVLDCVQETEEKVDVAHALESLSSAGLRRLLVEGGATVFTSFIRAGLWDALYLFHSPKAFGRGGVSAFSGGTAVDLDVVAVDAVRLDVDFLHRYLNRGTHEQITARLRSRIEA
jgi:diaminohydroxyphosphoribosylaminopyrimidine deaminase/5-amino-6-(5-phosphoribosylamino)uracil reductase